MRVPLMDLERIHAPLRDELIARISTVLDSQRFIMGPGVETFEGALAEYLGAGHALGVSSGTDALLAALMALGVGPGDEVVTSAFTFFATAGAVARLGARPVFADIQPDSFNLDPELALARVTPRTRAIVPVHLFGRVADMGPLLAARAAGGPPIIEDAAQAIGARDAQGRAAGTVGDLGCFSFFPAKNLGAFGDAGGVVTDDAEMAERVAILRVHGARPKYHHHVVGGNFRLDALQAAVLSVKLRGLDALTAQRRANAERYRAAFVAEGLAGPDGPLALPAEGEGVHVFNQFVLRVRDRERLRVRLDEAGVGCAVYYPQGLHLQPCFANLGYRAGDLPETERATGEALAIPVFPGLAADEQDYVVDTIARHYRQERGRRA